MSSHPKAMARTAKKMAARQPCRARSTTLPALMEELVEEILLRIPPEEPAHLVRAALVCKAWRRIILADDNRFLRRYRTFHRRRPPLLGFYYNDSKKHNPSFQPVIASAFPPLQGQCYLERAWCVLDCRHGRVLLEDLCGIGTNLAVVDPIGDDDWQQLRAHAHGLGYCPSYSAAVFCAAGGCDHYDCRRGGPFFVVYMGTDTMDATTVRAWVYSSEARAWGTPVSCQCPLDKRCHFDRHHRAAIIGDVVYFVVTPGARILKYDLVKRCISSFSSPSICSEDSGGWSPPIGGDAPVLMQNEDGSLGLASVKDSKLYVWSRMVNCREGIVAEWVQRRVIELDRILPIVQAAHAYVTGFAEGVGILFVNSDVGTFTFQLESGRVRKISRPINFSTAFPFISFASNPLFCF